ncbi:hypothetical protein FEM48_ZijujUnG0027200 [Ziziphus jujuba var. spinosa]|uniref:Uncharacterized protein n=1 Tax=Ziziphus jujuba var. spinosa TaxID=714518 RepID=A0A978U9M2_ZIZJJ|nr:hypothetical protein FEM48_ZijujUnG0027200 [Ziziphus jujuba var. spinosa]
MFGLKFERGVLATIERAWSLDWSSSIYPAYQTMPFHEVQAFEFWGDNLVEMGFGGGRVRVSFDSCVAGMLVGNVFEVKNYGFKPKRSGERFVKDYTECISSPQQEARDRRRNLLKNP